jgi:hypothetical protein
MKIAVDGVTVKLFVTYEWRGRCGQWNVDYEKSGGVTSGAGFGAVSSSMVPYWPKL